MNTRIAKVPYLNSLLYYYGDFWEGRFQMDEYVPRFSAQETLSGKAAAGLIPVAEYLANKAEYVRLRNFGIAVRGRAHSAMLFSRVPVRQLENATIAISEETCTSVRLLRLILEARYRLGGITYRRTAYEDPEAVLLIGDEALRMRQDGTQYPFEIDLGMEWWLWQHVPCVFAVWVARADLEEAKRKKIEAGIAKVLAQNTADLAAIAQSVSEKYGMSAETVEGYLRSFVYRFGPEEEEGVNVYEALLQKYDLVRWDPV